MTLTSLLLACSSGYNGSLSTSLCSSMHITYRIHVVVRDSSSSVACIMNLDARSRRCWWRDIHILLWLLLLLLLLLRTIAVTFVASKLWKTYRVKDNMSEIKERGTRRPVVCWQIWHAIWDNKKGYDSFPGLHDVGGMSERVWDLL